jgi:hypothetical protein
LDPFKVLWYYDDFSNAKVISNRDYISTSMFNRNYKTYKYNSFIFGSSRTIAFKTTTWKKYLKSNDNPFVFDASAESIYGIYTKMIYLDNLDVDIKNAIILICRDVSFNHTTNHSGHLFIKHPATSRENWVSFQFEFLKAYLSPKFITRYYNYLLKGKFETSMVNYINNQEIVSNPITNDLYIIDQEKELENNPEKYYKERDYLFYKRNGEVVDSVDHITAEYAFMLKEIKRIMIKHQTNYKIILSPLFDQTTYTSADKLFLKSLFENNLYDFSGKNFFTESKYNFYEQSHFRPTVGDSIFSIMYNSTLLDSLKFH